MNFKYYLNTYKKKDGTQAIRLKLETSKNDVQYIDSGISVNLKQWDASKQRVKRHALEDQFNGKLNDLKTNVQKLHYKQPGASAKRLKTIFGNLSKHDGENFLLFYNGLIAEMEAKNKHRTARANTFYLEKLKQYSAYISFQDFTPQFAKEYEIYLIKKGNKVNTIASNFKAINAALNKAVKLGIIDSNPLKGYSITTENVEKPFLNYEQILKLQNYEIHKRFKGKVLARDVFLFSFYCAGMRFSDVCNLKWENIKENEIVYTMEKSRNRSGSRRTIPLSKVPISILNKYKGKDAVYVFPVLYGMDKASLKDREYKIYLSNNSLNRSLKYLAKDLNFTDLNMHMAKHSFADYAVKNNVPILLLSKLLGHTKLSTTQHYLQDFYHKEQSETISKLFD